MKSSDGKISLTYSLADQSFARTKSLGILNVSLDLLKVLTRRVECERLTVLSNHTLENLGGSPAGLKAEYHDYAANHRPGRLLWDQFGVYRAAQRSGNDWLFLPKGFAAIARPCPVRLASLVHDVMQDHYDIAYPHAVFSLEAAYFRAGFRAALQYAEVIFTPTEFVLREVERAGRRSGRRLPRLVCCGEGFERTAVSPATERRDIVVLTSRFPHKLTRVAFDFLAGWQPAASFTERVHWVGSLPEKMELPDRTGWVRHPTLPETEFRALMAQARAVVFFSDYEGFGRPPVEAVLAGACPVYSDLPATREVMAGRGSPFDNADGASFGAALERALVTPRSQLEIWAEELLALHHWEKVANRIIAALQVDES